MFIFYTYVYIYLYIQLDKQSTTWLHKFLFPYFIMVSSKAPTFNQLRHIGNQ